jgi:cardiolipin synthase
MSSLTLVETDSYYEALLRELPRAKQRIVIADMIVLWGERTAPIFALLRDALARGVAVTILLDNFTRLSALYGLRPRSTRGQRIRQTFDTLEDLGRQGAKVYCFGKIGFPPYKGRCHVKITVIDDSSYSFGGINFLDQAFDLTDYMVQTKDKAIADHLDELVKRIGKTQPPLLDEVLEIDAQTTILFDGGRAKQSIIYERACELAARATHIDYVSLMAPSGQLAELLGAADATLYFNRPELMLMVDSWGQAFDQTKYRLTNNYKRNEYLHAKFILYTLPGGHKALLSGSHNFSYRGVSYGTQEIALYSTDPKLWNQLHAFLVAHIA